MPSETLSFNERATVATPTLAAPAQRRTRAHSYAVIPGETSFTNNKMSRFNIRVGSPTANAPRVFSRRQRRVRPMWLPVSRRRRIPVSNTNLFGRDSSFSAACGMTTAEGRTGWNFRKGIDRETLRSGELQIRRSAGNNVKNKFAATRSAKTASPCLAKP